MSLSSGRTSGFAEIPSSLSGGLVLAAFLVLGSYLRLADVGTALLFGDELHSLRDMHGGYGQILGHFSQTGGGLALPLIQRILLDIFGDGPWSVRAPAWVAGLALLYLTYPIARRHLGEFAAIAATALVAVMPLLIFYSHFARIYSLTAVLCLLLYDRLEEFLRASQWKPGAWLGLMGLTALIPWTHPTALGFVIPVYAGALLTLWIDREDAREFRVRAARLAGALAFAGLLCGLAYWPVRESLLTFMSEKTQVAYYGAFGPVDIASLVVGSRWAAMGLAIPALAALGAAALQLRGRSALLLSAVLGPPLTIALVQPYGDAYAYARYVMPGVVPLCIGLGWGLGQALGRIPRLGAGTFSAAAALAALALFFAGPLGPGKSRAPQHANTYLDMLSLPAFDEPWPDTPEFYQRLASLPESERMGLRLLEVPALTSRARHLYRNYQLQHGIPLALGPLPGEFPRIPSGPYFSFQRADWRESSGADYLVVHLDIARELDRYWRWVYRPGRGAPFSAEAAPLMERHRRYGGLLPRPHSATLAALRARLGPPVVADEELVVWDLRKEAGRSD
ncbi:MAG: glycosyltransferase family 39 protein [Myxococcota bacterium]|nr:glycosyltransferase family 39 protein [Myxococcota bacterium]